MMLGRKEVPKLSKEDSAAAERAFSSTLGYRVSMIADDEIRESSESVTGIESDKKTSDSILIRMQDRMN